MNVDESESGMVAVGKLLKLNHAYFYVESSKSRVTADLEFDNA